MRNSNTLSGGLHVHCVQTTNISTHEWQMIDIYSAYLLHHPSVAEPFSTLRPCHPGRPQAITPKRGPGCPAKNLKKRSRSRSSSPSFLTSKRTKLNPNPAQPRHGRSQKKEAGSGKSGAAKQENATPGTGDEDEDKDDGGRWSMTRGNF